MKPFAPQREDGRAEWRVLLDDLLVGLDFEALVTYEELSETLDRPFLPNRSPIYRAIKELRRAHSKSLENVPQVGYRVLRPDEHKLQANHYRRRSRHAAGTAVEVVTSTDIELLSPGERVHLEAYGMALRAMCQAIDAVDRRQRRTEVLLAQVVEKTEAQERRLDNYGEAMKAAGLLEAS